MTPLKKAVHRLTEAEIRDGSAKRKIVVGLLPGDLIEIRLQGMRRRLTVSIEAVYHLAARQQAEADRREKKRKK
jgi:hypothetical protein